MTKCRICGFNIYKNEPACFIPSKQGSTNGNLADLKNQVCSKCYIQETGINPYGA